MDFVVSFVLTAIFLKLLIIKAKKGQMTQTIREDGPQAHFAKAGTPTMGGVAFLLVMELFVFISLKFHFINLSGLLNDELSRHTLVSASMFICAIPFAMMGCLDDTLNIQKSRYLGIRPLYKFVSQFIFAVLFVAYFLMAIYDMQIENLVSFLIAKILSKDIFWILFVIIVIVGTVNAVNITDGLDGLAAGCVSLCFVPFLIYSIVQQQWGVTFFILMLLGCTTAFLWFNVHPAKIFMGNCGSMGLGAALASVAIVLHKEFMLLICGAVFVLETVSVILQVGYFKTTKKRIFKMAPIHHHFELLGYKETQVTHGLWLAGFASCIVGALVFKVLEFGF